MNREAALEVARLLLVVVEMRVADFCEIRVKLLTRKRVDLRVPIIRCRSGGCVMPHLTCNYSSLLARSCSGGGGIVSWFIHRDCISAKMARETESGVKVSAI